jgi:hypothetical protein
VRFFLVVCLAVVAWSTFALRIRDDFDDACSKGMSTGKSALDDVFDRYFLSCVQ